MSTINKEVIDAFVSTLQDLTVNSKPLINVLTMIADENEVYSKNIVEAIETHLSKVRLEVKLPILYLIDCIIKNVGRSYTHHFCQNIVTTFCGVFQVVDEKTRAEMFKLRQTWNDVLPKARLYSMDVQIRQIDPAWPITANIIHVNPKFLNANANTMAKKETPSDPATLVMKQKLLSKQKELVELQQKKIELELLQSKVKLEEEKLKSQLVSTKSPDLPMPSPQSKPHNLLLKPEVAKQLDNGCGDDNASSIRSGGGPFQQGTAQPPCSMIPPPKHQQQQIRFGVSSRDPRLLSRLQQQHQSNSNNISANNNSRNSPNKRLNNQRNNNSGAMLSASKHIGRSNIKRTTAKDKPISPPPTTESTSAHSKTTTSAKPSPATLDSHPVILQQQQQRKANRIKNSSSRKNVLSTTSAVQSGGGGSSSSSSGSPVKSTREILLHSPSNAPDQQDGGRKFRDLKGATKRRNYIKRNNNVGDPAPLPALLDDDGNTTSIRSPVAVTGGGGVGGGAGGGDVDLRTLDSFNQSPKLDISVKGGGDVDLRQIPASSSTSDKKRSSNVDSADRDATISTDAPPTKKSKSQMLDALFGSEDVDLRQAAAVAVSATRAVTPPPPPAPIISTAKSPTSHTGEDQDKDMKKANLDALRAKLASVSNKEKLREQKQQQRSKQQQQQTATGKPSPAQTVTLPEPLDSSIIRKIIMSSDDLDSMKAGKLSKEQETAIMAKIKLHFESEKLAQAKLKEREEEHVEDSDDDDDDDDDDEVVEVPASSAQNSGSAGRGGPLGVRGRFPTRSRGGLHQTPWRGGSGRWGQAPTPWLQPAGRWGSAGATTEHSIPPPPMPPTGSSTEAQPMLLQCASPEDARSINIDGCPRDIRFYAQTAIVFMSWDDPREISFQHGARRVVFDETNVFPLQLNDANYTEVSIDGQMHRIRLGAPTRELWVDGKYYEAIFGGKSIALELNGRMAMVQLEGPPPQVRIDTERRIDLVAGKIQLIVDAKTIVPVFLDARVQQIVIGVGETHQLQFVDGLRGVRFDGGPPIAVEFGGLPKAVHINRRKHFVRFSVLPRGIRPGQVHIRDMDCPPLVATATTAAAADQATTSSLPLLAQIPRAEELAGVPVTTFTPAMDESSQDVHHNIGGKFDALSNATNVSLNTSASEYHVEGTTAVLGSTSTKTTTSSSNNHNQRQHTLPAVIPLVVQPQVGNLLNINDLFQKLLASGIVSAQQQQQQQQQPQQQPPPDQHKHKTSSLTAKAAPLLLSVRWNNPDSLKVRQSGLVQLLYSGMQCSSCGERFPSAAGGSRLFSQHLDWHFRQNRRGKNSARNRKATSRRWYYSLADWKQYEEIEDLRERAEKNFFENQQQQKDDEGNGDSGAAPHDVDMLDERHKRVLDVTASVAADPDTTDPHCVVCEDRFEQFYNEELEEWHLRNAIAVDGQIYHPICYKDQQTASQTATVESAAIPGLDMDMEHDTKEDADADGNSVEEIQVIDDDDDGQGVEEGGSEVELITQGGDSDGNRAEVATEDGDDDDVILNEVQPEQIILDEYEWRGPEPAEDDAATSTAGGGGLIPGVVVKVEPLDDGFMDVGDSLQKTLEEPQVIDDECRAQQEEPQLAQLAAAATSAVEPTVEDGNVANCESPRRDEEMMSVDDEEHGSKVGGDQLIAGEPGDVDIGGQTDPMMATMDGNIDMDNTNAGPAAALAVLPTGGVGRIRINISKLHSKVAAAAIESSAAPAVGDSDGGGGGGTNVTVMVDPSQPLPPGEEPPLKPALRGVALRKQPTVQTGTELTGLCSIM